MVEYKKKQQKSDNIIVNRHYFSDNEASPELLIKTGLFSRRRQKVWVGVNYKNTARPIWQSSGVLVNMATTDGVSWVRGAPARATHSCTSCPRTHVDIVSTLPPTPVKVRQHDTRGEGERRERRLRHDGWRSPSSSPLAHSQNAGDFPVRQLSLPNA